MRVPMLDPALMHFNYQTKLETEAIRVLRSGQYILGKEVQTFENEFADYLGSKYAIGVSSGTDALIASLIALGIGPGDEVICPSFTFFATAGAISRVGATPVFVDISEKSFNISPRKIEEAVTEKTEAIIPVHLFGQSAEIDSICDVARRCDLFVIEDCAQAIGSEFSNGQKVGTFGQVGCFSFFPSKNLGGFGDAGLIITDSEAIAERIFCARNHGMTAPYKHSFVGGNFRIDALQAALLRVKLPYLVEAEESRRRHASIYYSKLKDSLYNLPTEDDGYHVYNQYTIKVPSHLRSKLQEFLKTKDISSAVYYPIPLHLQDCFSFSGNLPVTEKLSSEVLSIPIAAEITDSQINYVADSLLEFEDSLS